jgi:hypothetical protein
MRREQLQERDSPSIQALSSAACAPPPNQLTIPNFLAGLERTCEGMRLAGTGEGFGTRRSAGLDSITSVRNSAERKCCPLCLQRDRDDREAR